MFFHLYLFYSMHTKLFIVAAVGMIAVKQIKNEYVRASIGIPIVAFIMFMFLTMSVSAQWKPDRPDYTKDSQGNFTLIVKDRSDAIDICLTTLQANGVNLKNSFIDKKDDITPIFIRAKENDSILLLAYVTKKEFGEYKICFMNVSNEDGEISEDFMTLRYEGME